jgi:hypothetical protein
MDVYAQAVTPIKRQAQQKVLEQILLPAVRAAATGNGKGAANA